MIPGFGLRLGILLVVLCLSAGFERWQKGAGASRWREYLFLLLGGLVGSGLGAGVDQVSSQIGPEYFVFAKGIAPGATFALKVTLLGLQAGFVGGLVAAGIALWLNGLRAEPWSLTRLGWVVPWSLAGALVLAWPGAWLGTQLSVASELEDILKPDRLRALRAAWGLHLGVYAGALVGLLLGLRPRPALSDDPTP